MTDIPLQVLSDRSVLADRSVLSDRSVLAGRWTVVPDASECRFAVRDKLITTTFGTLPVTRGHVRVSGSGAVERSWVEVAVDRIETGNTTRDAHLCSPHILDAAAHPRIRVEWDRPSETQHGWTGTARLIARGASAPVELTVEAQARVGQEVRIRIRGRLDRSPLGIPVPSIIIGRFIDLDAELTLLQA
jgi:polyisoprenoid-binding protein YceI